MCNTIKSNIVLNSIHDTYANKSNNKCTFNIHIQTIKSYNMQKYTESWVINYVFLTIITITIKDIINIESINQGLF